MRVLAEASSAGSALVLGVISGIVAIVVAFFGYLGTRTRPGRVRPDQQQVQADPSWLVDLRKERDDYKSQIKAKDCEIERLEIVCMANAINPKTGDKITVNLRRNGT